MRYQLGRVIVAGLCVVGATYPTKSNATIEKENAQVQNASDSYANAVKMFSCKEPIVCCEDTLMNYLKKVKHGTGMAVFGQCINDSTADVPICRFDIESGRIVNPEVMTKSKTETVGMQQFLSCCCEPALLLYRNKVYLNFPTMKAKYAEGKKVGELLWPQYSVTQQLLSIVNPTTKLRYNILIPEIGRVPIGECQIDDAVSRQVVVKAACGYVEQVAARAWKKKHDAMVKKLPRRPPVVYGNVKSITRNMVGTYIIPREAPPTEKTITWTETVWANAHGTGRTASGERVGVDVSVPVGERTCSRTKKISSAMKYDQLKQQLEEYEAQVRAIENDKPPKADEDAVLEKLQSGCELIFSINKR